MNRRLQYTEWVKNCHEGQLIRKTNIPYFEHLLFVAKAAGPYFEYAYEIGLGHDLFEKTDLSEKILRQALIGFGYDPDAIVISIIELTNHFTKISYPDLSKRKRKKLEDERLQSIGAIAQTVKYADLEYNAAWVVKHDLSKAGKYLKRKIKLLNSMKKGNQGLKKKVLLQLNKLTATLC